MSSRQLSGLMLGIALLSWGGLGYVVLTQSPSALTEALFFPLLFLAVTGVSVPGLAWLRSRLGKEDEPGVVLRQGIWFGLGTSICAALQLARVLDVAIVAVMVAFFALLECFLLQRPERWRSLWYEQIIRRRHSRGRGQGARGKGQDARSKRQEARGKRQGARGKRQEARSKRQGVRGKRQEARGKGQEARGKGQEARGKMQEARGKGQGAGSKIIAGVLIMAAVLLAACASPVALPAPPTATPPAAAAEGTGEVITLPAPRLESDVSLEEALQRRRSVRVYSDQPLSLEEIGQLLWAAQGITDERGYRTAPSAGALYPLELYVATDEGLYHYRPQGHQAEVRRVEGWREALCPAALSQGAVCQAPAVFVVTAVYARTAAKYGQRAERYVRLEAGHAAQNLLLQAVALDLGAVPIGAFYDDQVQAALGLPADHEPLYLIPVGRLAR